MEPFQAREALRGPFNRIGFDIEMAVVKNKTLLRIPTPSEEMASTLIASINSLFPGKKAAFGNQTDGVDGNNISVYLDTSILTDDEFIRLTQTDTFTDQNFPISGQNFGNPIPMNKPIRFK